MQLDMAYQVAVTPLVDERLDVLPSFPLASRSMLEAAEGFVETEDDRAWALHLESMALHSLGRQAESAAALARLESEFGDRYAILIA